MSGLTGYGYQRRTEEDEVMPFVLDEEFYDHLFDRGLLPEPPSKSKTSSRPATPQETNKQESILESHQDDVVQFEDDPSELSDNLSELSHDSQTELSCCSPGKPLISASEKMLTPKTPDGIGDAVKAKPTNINCLGLPNLSNTCYMNSSLQGLLTLENFVQDLQHQKQVWDPLSDAQLLREFLAIKDAHTSSDINSKRSLLYSFKDVVSVQAPEFCDYEQKDAHEFITSVLNQMRNLSPLLQDIATCMGQTYTCPVERNMVFQMENIRTCKRCGKQSRRDEVFTNLSLDLFPGVSVEEMLQEYQKETKLEYKCECGGRTSGQRSTFKTMPKVLILHLKRFWFTSDYRMEKLHYAIKLQSNLQVSGNEDTTSVTAFIPTTVQTSQPTGGSPSTTWKSLKQQEYLCE
ncbi:ubiquitin carboxyl-terminal hydrolase 37-like [Gymnodraco acuticeps]|uniref:Ubiquitin carboxyl-terminal hydrolase 37-like n=1 Tax=Gymnodraco acuticeps TaxID=8218 RepID=A0A6P8VEJ2_GYMAC|nr:ubiquitin carboxyl-terminal hydrolase 37-like [Gymnodraco acuticeps]